MMAYKGYSAGPIDFNPEDKIFSGVVAGLKDVVHFKGTTADELAAAFRDSIDDYLSLCADLGAAPSSRNRHHFGKSDVQRLNDRDVSTPEEREFHLDAAAELK